MKMGNIKILLVLLKKIHYFKDGKMTKNISKSHKISIIKNKRAI